MRLLSRTTQLPPGQRKLDGFPRFGGPSSPPSLPAKPGLEITGAVREPVTVALSELSALPRTERASDFHCVAGWSAVGLRWEGIGFTTFYRAIIEPRLSATTTVTHLVFRGLDHYRAIVCIDDAMQKDVLLADRLCAIEIHTSAPSALRGSVLFRMHPRARVWREERNGVLPAVIVRPVYRSLIRPFMRRGARGDWN